MTIFQAIILGIVEGLTEFLPVSSTGHLTIVAKMLGLSIDDPSVTGFTAVIQVGAILAVVIYFWKDIVTLVKAWARGLFTPEKRADPDYRLAWLVLIGSLPIVVVGFLARDLISGPLRSLWVVAFSLIIWGFVMLVAEAVAKQDRGERDLTLADALIIGFAQCLALFPGVSRSGATISVGLMRGLDRVTATRLAFLLGIPALLGAGVYELPAALDGGVGWLPTLVATRGVFRGRLRHRRLAAQIRGRAHHPGVRLVPLGARRGDHHRAQHRRIGSDLTMTPEPTPPAAAAATEIEPVTQDGKPAEQPRPPVITVVLVRHGRSTANTAGLLAGRTPGVQLDEHGQGQAAQIAERLAAARFDRLISSPLERCLQTITPFSKATGLDSRDRRTLRRGRLRRLVQSAAQGFGDGAALEDRPAAPVGRRLPRRRGAGRRVRQGRCRDHAAFGCRRTRTRPC